MVGRVRHEQPGDGLQGDHGEPESTSLTGVDGVEPDQIRERAFISLQSVTKHYGETEILSDISLDIEPGRKVVICGRSGSGKSTLLRCVNGLEPISAGRIFVGEHEVRTDRPRELREIRARVGMVFQHFELYPHLSVRRNITLAPQRVHGLSKGDADRVADALLERVGLLDHAKKYPSQLSGGQKQRIAIARALALSPTVMLFDEPTSALDPEMIHEVLEVIRMLAEGGMTMIIVTHELGFARDVADEVVFIDGGQIIERGDPDRIIKSPTRSETQEFFKTISTH